MVYIEEQFRKNWLAALRSGDYDQGHNTLYNNFENTYCCLGVACDILDIRNIEGISYPNKLNEKDSAIFKKNFPNNTERDYRNFLEILSILNDSGPAYSKIGNRATYSPPQIRENTESFSFNEIADIIEISTKTYSNVQNNKNFIQLILIFTAVLLASRSILNYFKNESVFNRFKEDQELFEKQLDSLKELQDKQERLIDSLMLSITK